MDNPNIYLFGDNDAERKILSCMTTSNAWIARATRDCSIEDFANPFYAKVFHTIKLLHEKGQPTDALNVAQHLADSKQAENMSVLDIYNDFELIPFGDAYYENALLRLKEKSRGRMIYRTCETALNMLKQGNTTDDVVSKLTRLMSDITTHTGFKREVLGPMELANSIITTVQNYQDPQWRKEHIIMTGIAAIDERIQGFAGGDLIIVSGATGTGKSAFAIDLSFYTGVVTHVPIIYINSEMDQDQVNLRLAARSATVSHSALRGGTASTEDLQRVVKGTDDISKGALNVTKCPDLCFDNIKEVLDDAVAKKIKFAVVDYFGRCDFLSQNIQEWQALKISSQKLKSYAQQANIVIILLAQTNAEGELAKSKQIAQDADFWFNLIKAKGERPYNYALEIKKARSVAKGDKDIGMLFDGDHQTFIYDRVEAEKKYDELVLTDEEEE